MMNAQDPIPILFHHKQLTLVLVLIKWITLIGISEEGAVVVAKIEIKAAMLTIKFRSIHQ
jgi:hypothetical protein